MESKDVLCRCWALYQVVPHFKLEKTIFLTSSKTRESGILLTFGIKKKEKRKLKEEFIFSTRIMKYYIRFLRYYQLQQPSSYEASVDKGAIEDSSVDGGLSTAALICFIMAVPLTIWSIQTFIRWCLERCIQGRFNLEGRNPNFEGHGLVLERDQRGHYWL